MQNQYLWRHFGDKMSPGNQGGFLAPERGDFLKDSEILQLIKIGLF